jgi:hypothetical protein
MFLGKTTMGLRIGAPVLSSGSLKINLREIFGAVLRLLQQNRYVAAPDVCDGTSAVDPHRNSRDGGTVAARLWSPRNGLR